MSVWKDKRTVMKILGLRRQMRRFGLVVGQAETDKGCLFTGCRKGNNKNHNSNTAILLYTITVL